MKIIEESQLKKTISQLNNYQETQKSVENFYNCLDKITLDSLQIFSFEQDNDLFNEISFVESVIATIISHPHLIIRGDDEIVRAGTAGAISNEGLLRLFKEPDLWKEKDYEMVPEYVHHYQYTDELKIYENIFIGMLIRLIDLELAKYSEFYMSLIPSITNDTDEILESENIEKGLEKIEGLFRRLRFIKNSYFYKEISKCDLSLKPIQPTNILLKNRLYNYCFKFYRKFIQYQDKESLDIDFRKYYLFTILKVFKKHNVKIDKTKKQTFENLNFIYNDINISVELGNNPSEINVNLNGFGLPCVHKILLSTERNLENINNKELFYDEIVSSINLINLWNIFEWDKTLKPVFNNTVSEEKMIDYWFENRFKEVIVHSDIYKKYCPICKTKNINFDKGIYKCFDCGSEYVLKHREKTDVIWFLKMRR